MLIFLYFCSSNMFAMLWIIIAIYLLVCAVIAIIKGLPYIIIFPILPFWAAHQLWKDGRKGIVVAFYVVFAICILFITFILSVVE